MCVRVVIVCVLGYRFCVCFYNFEDNILELFRGYTIEVPFLSFRHRCLIFMFILFISSLFVGKLHHFKKYLY